MMALYEQQVISQQLLFSRRKISIIKENGKLLFATEQQTISLLRQNLLPSRQDNIATISLSINSNLHKQYRFPFNGIILDLFIF